MKRFSLVPSRVRFSQTTSLTFNKKKSLEATTNIPDTKMKWKLFKMVGKCIYKQ